METKLCSKCYQIQPASNFYRSQRWRDGYHPWCKSCFNIAGKARYEARCAKYPPQYRWNRDAVRHNYFAIVTRPLQAYLLGLLAADGNVLASVPRISMELSMRDVELLTLVRDELAPAHQIRERTRVNKHVGPESIFRPAQRAGNPAGLTPATVAASLHRYTTER